MDNVNLGRHISGQFNEDLENVINHVMQLQCIEIKFIAKQTGITDNRYNKNTFVCLVSLSLDAVFIPHVKGKLQLVLS